MKPFKTTKKENWMHGSGKIKFDHAQACSIGKHNIVNMAEAYMEEYASRPTSYYNAGSISKFC